MSGCAAGLSLYTNTVHLKAKFDSVTCVKNGPSAPRGKIWGVLKMKALRQEHFYDLINQFILSRGAPCQGRTDGLWHGGPEKPLLCPTASLSVTGRSLTSTFNPAAAADASQVSCGRRQASALEGLVF